MSTVKLKAGETVVFWIVYKSRAHRNRVNYAGFKVVADA